MNAQPKGLVFDIRRFSTHDGEGIRTTAFLKGCPLRCVWCQNPEGMAAKPRFVHFQERCISCGRCLHIADGAMQRAAGGIMQLKAEKVRQPALYEEICPAAALKMDSRWYEIEALAAELLRDKVFFQYGGGVTLSGGEPFFQKEFVGALLRRLKKEGLHTAVETSLFAGWETIEAAMPWIDTLFADFKIADDSLHQKMTGVSNRSICENLRRVLQSRKRDCVIVRTPLIPQFTAERENIVKIAQSITQWYPNVRYELLNYNPLAQAKYVHMPQSYCFAQNPPLYSAKQMEEFHEIARRAGVRNLIVDA